YAPSTALAFGEARGRRPLLRPAYDLAREVMPYISTPLRLLARELRAQNCAAMLCSEYEFPRFDVCALLSRFIDVPLFGRFGGADWQTWRLERVTRPLALRSCSGLIVSSQREIDRVERTYSFPPSKIAN